MYLVHHDGWREQLSVRWVQQPWVVKDLADGQSCFRVHQQESAATVDNH